MMERWFNAQQRRTAPAYTALSACVHVLLISALAYQAEETATDGEQPQATWLVQYIVPQNRLAGQEYQRERISYFRLAVPEGVLDVPDILPQSEAPKFEVQVRVGEDLFDTPETPEIAGLDSVFSIVDVDSAASRFPWSAAPVFPPNMLANRIPGFVRAQWVVDTNGMADTASLVILESTHPDFAASVRTALPMMRFRPARIGARVVRQRVEQDFNFQIAPLPVDSARPDTVPPARLS